MKKILSIFAAALVALAVNATPVEPGAGTLKAAISAAEAGAVIELATGVFKEESAIGLGKNLTIKAADGAVPVIKAVGFGIQGGATVTFEGIKFDASTTASHLIYANDATAGNQLICEGCEFYDYTLNSSLIHVGGSSLLDVCTINNCYIHNIKKSFIFNENKTNAFDLTVSNSTIANITTDTESYYAGVIDSRATSGTVRVNQCTFYNVLAMNTDYAAVGKISASGATVSNSIFAMPASTGNLRAIRDVSAANNCLTYNYTKDSNRGIHSDVAKNNCIFGQDPLFADAANGDYTLNEENSPAKGAGQGGTHLGDPRWWPASWKPAEIIEVTSVALDAAELTIDVNETAFLHATVLPDDATDPTVTWTSSDKAVATVVDGAVKGIAAGTATITAKAGDKTATCIVTVSDAIPSTDFAAPYFLKGTKAVLDGNIYLSEADSLHYKDKSVCGTATWKINVLTNGIFEATANYKTGSSSGAKLRIVILDKDENQVGDSLTCDYYDKDGDKALSGSITLLEAGVYTIKLVNIQPWSSAKLNGITLTKTGEVPQTLYLKPGVWDADGAKFAVWDITHEAWSGFMTLAENETDIYTTIIPADAEKVIFVRLNGALEAPDWDGKWNQTADLDLIENRDLFTITGWGEEKSTGEWSKYGAKFYISGSMTSWSPSIVSLTDSYTFKNLAAGNYSFKVIAPEGWFGYAQLTPASKAIELYPDQDDNVCFTLAEAGDVVVTYIKDEVFKVEGNLVLPEVTLQGIPDWDNPSVLVAATDKLSASVTVSLDANWGYELKIVCGGTWLGKDANPKYELTREVTSVSGLTYTGDNMKLSTDKAGEYTFTWTFATRILTVTYPDLDHENGFYLAGTFSGVEKWSVDAITADKQFEWYKKTGIGDNDEWKLSITVAEGDELKACYIYKDNITDENWFPGGETPRYTVDAAHAGKVNIYLRPAGDGGEGWWYNTLYVEKDVPSALDNTNADAKVIKTIENGQLVIIKNGIRYNAQGAVVK